MWGPPLCKSGIFGRWGGFARLKRMRGIVFFRILDRLEEILIGSLIAAATLLIFVSVVQRYLIGVPFLYPYFYDFNITWAQEPVSYTHLRAHETDSYLV